MHRTVIILMSLEVGGRGAIGFRIIRNASDGQHFHVFEVGGRGAIGFRIIRNAWNGQHFHGFGSGREGGGWLQNHKKCIGLL